MKPEICFVIPTHNRVTELRRNIAQIISACESTVDHVQYAIYLMDNSSNDETFNFFSADVHPRVFYSRRESYVANGNESMHQIISEVNIDADWYWWLGDDDFILSNGILKIKKYIKDPTLGYIHATDVSNQIVHQDTIKPVRDLIGEFGFMDLFGFMSSQILSKRVFLKFRDTISTCPNVNWDYNFNQMMFLTKALWGEIGVVLAGDVISAQNMIFNKDQPKIENHTNGSTFDEDEFASFYNSLRGWFNLSDCLESFTDQVPFTLPAAHSYFRFKGKPVWISFIMWMAKYGNASQLNIDESDYHRIRRLISMGEGDVSVYHSMLEFVYRLNELNKVADKTLRSDVIDNTYISFLTYLHYFRTP